MEMSPFAVRSTKIQYPCAHCLSLSWSTCLFCSLAALRAWHTPHHHHHDPHVITSHCSLRRIKNINTGTSTTQSSFNHSVLTRVVSPPQKKTLYIFQKRLYSPSCNTAIIQKKKNFERCYQQHGNCAQYIHESYNKVLPVFGDSQGKKEMPLNRNENNKNYNQIFTCILVCTFF